MICDDCLKKGHRCAPQPGDVCDMKVSSAQRKAESYPIWYWDCPSCGAKNRDTGSVDDKCGECGVKVELWSAELHQTRI